MLFSATLPLMPMLGATSANASAETTFFTGIEADNQDGRRLDLGLSVNSSAGTTFDLAGSRAETSSDALDFTSSSILGRIEHDFGRFGLGAGVRHVRDDDLSKTLGWLGSAFIDVSDARLSASIESRGTDFDATPFTASGSELGLTGVTSASGTAACSTDSLGYSLGLRVTSGSWSFYGSGTLFDYSSYGCEATITSTTSDASPAPTPSPPGSRAPVSVRRPQVAGQLAAPVLDRFSGYSSTRLPYEAALLESSAMLGAAFAAGIRTVGFELYRHTEEFSSADTMVAVTYLAFPLGQTAGMEIALGASDTQNLDNVLFAGLRFSMRLGQ